MLIRRSTPLNLLHKSGGVASLLRRVWLVTVPKQTLIALRWFNGSSRYLEASYSNWFLEVTKDVPTKLLRQITKTKDSQTPVDVPQVNLNPVERGFKYLSDDEVEHILSLQKLGQLDEIHKCLENHKSNKHILPIETFLIILQDPILANPNKETLIEQTFLENLNYLIDPYYKNLSHRVPIYYEICKLYESIYINGNKAFQELFIRFCYHLNDFDTLKFLCQSYLNNETYDSSTISYILCGYTSNYEIEEARLLFNSITNKVQDLNIQVLETLLQQYVVKGALFYSILQSLEVWILSRNHLPSAKAMATVLSQAHRYGTMDEIHEVNGLIHRYNLTYHYLIREVKLKFNITNRSRTSFKKEVLRDDIEEVNDIAKCLYDLNDEKKLKEFYYRMLSFFSRYTDIRYVEFIIHKMKSDKLEFCDTFYKELSKNYVIHEKFIPLVRYLQSIREKVEFSPVYIIDLFECFIKTYPHYGIEFSQAMTQWIRENNDMDNDYKQYCLSKLKVTVTGKQFHPVILWKRGFDDKKYNSKQWNQLDPHKKSHSKYIKQQVKFRVDKGFKDLVKRGIRPDYHMIEETFRRLNLYYKTKLLELAQIIRMDLKNQNRLSTINLEFATKSELIKYLKYKLDSLNSNNKIVFSRILLNKNLDNEALQVLNTVNLNELPDRSHLMVLNLTLRSLVKLNKFDEIINTLNDFSISEITLTPFIHQQCLFIEKELCKKLNTTTANTKQNDIEKCLNRTRSFIGDIRIILERDKLELDSIVHQCFMFLEEWLKSCK